MRRRQKGFTLAELLAVVGIIAVLVAVAIPIFSGAVEKAALAADHANARAAYSVVQLANLTGEVAVDGTVMKLEDLAAGGIKYATLYYAGSGLTTNPDNAYHFQASGVDGDGACEECARYDVVVHGSGATSHFGVTHTKDSGIMVTWSSYGESVHLVLGFTS